MPEDSKVGSELAVLRREVAALRARVADLQRTGVHPQRAQSLAEREELLCEAERVGQLGTFCWDLASGRVTWSEQLYRILGCEPGSVEPSLEAYFARIHEEDRARARAIA
ncbi:MAG TPA: hypothetical protein VJR89_20135, partial [Polyangiales bacterium]|nr:hypothetical protein [Polyangiales bacterium]